ncbi:DNA translocase FtsK, partial [Microvirga sp. 2TAF3]|uniref:DNA translocase FtsK n=1 Tax=Microvirga sp. 2TAF3 TaxID=3233014 RepID=UPI003F95712D
MQSTQKPPFYPSLHADSKDADQAHQAERANILSLRRAAGSEGVSKPVAALQSLPSSGFDERDEAPLNGSAGKREAAEPAWSRAFVTSDGARFTRTPDRVLRKRNGKTESGVIGVIGQDNAAIAPLALSASPATGARPSSGQVQRDDSVQQKKQAVAQIARLRAEFASRIANPAAAGEAETAVEPTEAGAQSDAPVVQASTARPTQNRPSRKTAVSAASGDPEPATEIASPPAHDVQSPFGAFKSVAYRFGYSDQYRLEPASLTVSAGFAAPSNEPVAAVAVEDADLDASAQQRSDDVESDSVDIGYLALYESKDVIRERQPQKGEGASVPSRMSAAMRHARSTALGLDVASGERTLPAGGSVEKSLPPQNIFASDSSFEESRPGSVSSLVYDSSYELPSLNFLAEPPPSEDPSPTDDVLEETAGRVEKVIRDFGVKGDVIHVHPGPVVTLYELEPAPGTKSSRVMALSDDIARSMSAVSARVAVIPGRNAIGIELPNPKRETVYLRELLASQDFETSKQKLPLCLGKTIGGEPVIADLARMPHLLVAGTTGSGKSVAINTMILSLLYRFTPEQCRLIMVDPKMLELSVYDGIPHLLTPVVTDPKKAIIALRWAVREMEDRYKKMSKLGVRNIDGFNARVSEAKAKGEVITRTVQTGFDRET